MNRLLSATSLLALSLVCQIGLARVRSAVQDIKAKASVPFPHRSVRSKIASLAKYSVTTGNVCAGGRFLKSLAALAPHALRETQISGDLRHVSR